MSGSRLAQSSFGQSTAPGPVRQHDGTSVRSGSSTARDSSSQSIRSDDSTKPATGSSAELARRKALAMAQAKQKSQQQDSAPNEASAAKWAKNYRDTSSSDSDDGIEITPPTPGPSREPTSLSLGTSSQPGLRPTSRPIGVAKLMSMPSIPRKGESSASSSQSRKDATSSSQEPTASPLDPPSSAPVPPRQRKKLKTAGISLNTNEYRHISDMAEIAEKFERDQEILRQAAEQEENEGTSGFARENGKKLKLPASVVSKAAPKDQSVTKAASFLSTLVKMGQQSEAAHRAETKRRIDIAKKVSGTCPRYFPLCQPFLLISIPFVQTCTSVHFATHLFRRH